MKKKKQEKKWKHRLICFVKKKKKKRKDHCKPALMNCYMNKRYLRTKVEKNMKIKKSIFLTTSSNQFFILSLLPWSLRRRAEGSGRWMISTPPDNEAQVSHSKHRGNPPRMFIMASAAICRVFTISLDLLFSLPLFFLAETGAVCL